MPFKKKKDTKTKEDKKENYRPYIKSYIPYEHR